MAELLLRNTDGVSGLAHRGDIIEVRANDSPIGGKEVLPLFCHLKIPTESLASLRSYAAKWRFEIGFTEVAHNATLDGYRMRAFCSNINSLKGHITRDMIEQYLLRWGASVFSVAPNEVVFDYGIYNAIKSRAFWDVDITAAIYNEVDYDEATGVHTVSVDYSAYGNNPSYVERMVDNKGGIVTAHSNKVIKFALHRDVVHAEVQRQIEERLNKLLLGKAHFYLPVGVMNTIEAAGGVYTATLAEFLTYVKDKLDD